MSALESFDNAMTYTSPSGRVYIDSGPTHAYVDELLAELERLKVCGSCEHCNPKGPWCREAGNLWNFEAAEAGWDWLLTDGSIDDRVGLHFKCHFTPSRWTEAKP